MDKTLWRIYHVVSMWERKDQKMNLSKKIAACSLAGILACQPMVFSGFGNFTIAAEAHSGHHADRHHDGGYADSYETYYYCDGHAAHLHDGGVCPYAFTAASPDDDSVYVYDEAGQSSSSQSTVIDMSGKTVELSTGDRIGLSRNLIMIVQDVLNQKGYDCGTVDGSVGAKTKEAIEKYLDENESEDMDSLIISMVAEGLGIQ